MLDREELPRLFAHKLSPHQIDLREVLAVAELRGTLPTTMMCLGIEPARVELHAGLSPEIAARLDILVDAAALQLRSWGHALERVPRDNLSPSIR